MKILHADSWWRISFVSQIFLIYLQESSVTKILNLDAGVTQISLSSMETDLQTKLIVSTETRTIVCDTMKQSFIEIGNQSR